MPGIRWDLNTLLSYDVISKVSQILCLIENNLFTEVLTSFSFEIVPLHSNTPILVFLSLLLSNLEVILLKRVEDCLQFTPDLNDSLESATFELHFRLGKEMEVYRCFKSGK